MTPTLVLLAGPNGAGKSTYYELFLAEAGLPFLNADLVAAHTQIDSFAAARMLDALRDRMIEERQSFISETVFSDPGGEKLAMLRRAVDAGYDVTLIYIGIANPALSAERVAGRVRHGGHDVPRDKLGPRFERSLKNLAVAFAVVPLIEVYDNSSPTDPYRHVATVKAGKVVRLAPLPAWLKRIVPRARPSKT